MDMQLLRRWVTDKSLTGELLLDGAFECFTLEGSSTAIPEGRYEVIINHSPRFDQDMPLLLDVPGYVGVRIHWGNWPKDTRGCPLVGEERASVPDEILNSRAAYEALLPKMLAARERGERIFIDVKLEAAQGTEL